VAAARRPPGGDNGGHGDRPLRVEGAGEKKAEQENQQKGGCMQCKEVDRVRVQVGHLLYLSYANLPHCEYATERSEYAVRQVHHAANMSRRQCQIRRAGRRTVANRLELVHAVHVGQGVEAGVEAVQQVRHLVKAARASRPWSAITATSKRFRVKARLISGSESIVRY
jgi:hypothetical protein